MIQRECSKPKSILSLSKLRSPVQNKKLQLGQRSFVDALFMRAHINALDQEYESARQDSKEKVNNNKQATVISINVGKLNPQSMTAMRNDPISVLNNGHSVTSTEGLDSRDSVIERQRMTNMVQQSQTVSTSHCTVVDEGICNGVPAISADSARADISSAEEIGTMTARFDSSFNNNHKNNLIKENITSPFITGLTVLQPITSNQQHSKLISPKLAQPLDENHVLEGVALRTSATSGGITFSNMHGSARQPGPIIYNSDLQQVDEDAPNRDVIGSKEFSTGTIHSVLQSLNKLQIVQEKNTIYLSDNASSFNDKRTFTPNTTCIQQQVNYSREMSPAANFRSEEYASYPGSQPGQVLSNVVTPTSHTTTNAAASKFKRNMDQRHLQSTPKSEIESSKHNNRVRSPEQQPNKVSTLNQLLKQSFSGEQLRPEQMEINGSSIVIDARLKEIVRKSQFRESQQTQGGPDELFRLETNQSEMSPKMEDHIVLQVKATSHEDAMAVNERIGGFEGELENVGCQVEGDTITTDRASDPSRQNTARHTNVGGGAQFRGVITPSEQNYRTSDGLTEQERLEIKQTLKLVYPGLAISQLSKIGMISGANLPQQSKTACSRRRKSKRATMNPSRTMSPEFSAAIMASQAHANQCRRDIKATSPGGASSNMIAIQRNEQHGLFSPVNENHVSSPNLARFSKMPSANRTFMKPGWIAQDLGQKLKMLRAEQQLQLLKQQILDEQKQEKKWLYQEEATAKNRVNIPSLDYATLELGTKQFTLTTCHDVSVETSNRNSVLQQLSSYYGEREVSMDLRLLDKITQKETYLPGQPDQTFDTRNITRRQVASSGNVKMPSEDQQKQLNLQEAQALGFILGQKKPFSERMSKLKGGCDSQVINTKEAIQQPQVETERSRQSVVKVIAVNRSNQDLEGTFSNAPQKPQTQIVSSGEVSLAKRAELSPSDITISPRAVHPVPKLSIINTQWTDGSQVTLCPLSPLRTSHSNISKNVSATAITEATTNTAAWRQPKMSSRLASKKQNQQNRTPRKEGGRESPVGILEGTTIAKPLIEMTASFGNAEQFTMQTTQLLPPKQPQQAKMQSKSNNHHVGEAERMSGTCQKRTLREHQTLLLDDNATNGAKIRVSGIAHCDSNKTKYLSKNFQSTSMTYQQIENVELTPKTSQLSINKDMSQMNNTELGESMSPKAMNQSVGATKSGNLSEIRFNCLSKVNETPKDVSNPMQQIYNHTVQTTENSITAVNCQLYNTDECVCQRGGMKVEVANKKDTSASDDQSYPQLLQLKENEHSKTPTSSGNIKRMVLPKKHVQQHLRQTQSKTTTRPFISHNDRFSPVISRGRKKNLKPCLGELLNQKCNSLSQKMAQVHGNGRPEVQVISRKQIESLTQQTLESKQQEKYGLEKIDEDAASQNQNQLLIGELASVNSSSSRVTLEQWQRRTQSNIKARLSPIESSLSNRKKFESVERLNAFRSTALNKHAMQPYVKSDCKYVMTSTVDTLKTNMKLIYGINPAAADSEKNGFKLKKVPLQSKDGHFMSNVASPQESTYAKRKLLSKQRKELALHVQNQIRSRQLDMGYNLASPAARMRSLMMTEQKKKNATATMQSGLSNPTVYHNISGLKTWRTGI